MLQEYFKTDQESTFLDFGDYCEQKKNNNDAPYDNMVLSTNYGVETKVLSFACFCPNKKLKSCTDVCPSLIEWAEYILAPAIETNNQKKDRQQKLGENQ
jgi:hypothetical protein